MILARSKNSVPRRRAFTLLELIVVIVILGVLVALAIPLFSKVISKSKLETQTTETAAFGRNALALRAISETPYTEDIFNDAHAEYSDSSRTGSKSLDFTPGAHADADSIVVSFTPDSFFVASWSSDGCSVVEGQGASVKAKSVSGVSAENCKAEEVPDEENPGGGEPVEPALGAPALRVEDTSSIYTISWDAVEGATGYELSGEGWTINGTSATKPVYNDSEDVAVRAVGDEGASNWTPTETLNFTGGTASFQYDLNAPGCSTINPNNVLFSIRSAEGVFDWGDGTNQAFSGDYPAHNYATLGEYDVTFRGTIGRLYANSGEYAWDMRCLISVDTYQNLRTTSFEQAFSSAANLVHLDPQFDTSDALSMRRMFNSATLFNENISHWDTSKVTDMSQMFSNAWAFNNGDAGDTGAYPLTWDTSDVTTMQEMFNYALKFNQPLPFDTTSVTNMSGMFKGAAGGAEIKTNFNQHLDWETPLLENASSMFSGADKFNQPFNLHAPKLTTASGMFSYARVMNSPVTITGTNDTLLTLNNMFRWAPAFNSSVSIEADFVTSATYMFASMPEFNQPVTLSLPKVTNTSYMFYASSKMNSPVTLTNTTKLDNVASMFTQMPVFNATVTLNTSAVQNFSYMFASNPAYNQPMNHWNVSSGTNFNSMFTGSPEFNQPLNSWVMTSATDVGSMFYKATKFDQNLSGWSVQNVGSSKRGNFVVSTAMQYKPAQHPVWAS